MTPPPISTRIVSNGWLGSLDPAVALPQIFALLEVHVLDPTVTSGRFAYPSVVGRDWRFAGNFREFSHVFQFHTDDPEVITRMLVLVKANKRRVDYELCGRDTPARKSDLVRDHRCRLRFAEQYPNWPG